MHSVYQIKKNEREKEFKDSLLIRTESKSPDAHRAKTLRMAERYELRLDEWLMTSAQCGVDTLEQRQLACDHKFRDSVPEKWLGSRSCSPGKYVFERDRIENTISTQQVMRNRYNEVDTSVFRSRDEPKEIQPRLRFSHKTEDERINNRISLNPVMPLQPWTRYDNPIYRKFREENNNKWKAGGDFDRYSYACGNHVAPQSEFLLSSLPFERAFGSKADDFRPRDNDKELGSEFRNVVPGFHTDNIPGKWKMDLSLYSTSSPRILSPHTVTAQNSRSVGPAEASVGSDPELGGLRLFQKMQKEYWKSGQQVTTSQPKLVASYEAIGSRSFDSYQERASTAKKVVQQRFGNKRAILQASKSTKSSGITPHGMSSWKKNKPDIELQVEGWKEQRSLGALGPMS